MFISVALIALVAACFFPTLGNEFLPNWDDHFYLQDNPIVRGGLALEGVRRAFTTRHGGNWIPVTWLSHMADVSAFGLVAWKHRLVNVALHAGNAVLVFSLLRLATGALWPSAVTAALFAVHPLRVESVVWVAERKDVLSACLGLLSLLAYLRWVAGRRPAAFAATAILFSLSLMAKPMLVTLPALMILLDWWPLGRIDRCSWRERIREKIPLALISAAIAVVTLVTQSRAGAMRQVAPAERLMEALVGYAGYLRLTVLPLGLSPLYPAFRSGSGMSAAAGALLVVLLITVGVVRLGHRFPWLVSGWVWYLVALAPVSGIVPVGSQIMADRYTYLPLVGPVAAAVWTSRGLVASRRRLTAPLAVAACLTVGILGALTIRQGRFWRDELTLFLYAADRTPPNAELEYDLAVFRQQSGDLVSAERHYRRAIALDPGMAEAMVNLGEMLFARGDPQGAAALYRAAIEHNPRLATAWNNLGAVQDKAGRREEALSNYRHAVELAPGFAAARLNLGATLAASGREEEAREQFAQAVKLDPTSALARYQLGVALARAGQFAEAVSEFAAAAARAPDDAQIREAHREAQRHGGTRE